MSKRPIRSQALRPIPQPPVLLGAFGLALASCTATSDEASLSSGFDPGGQTGSLPGSFAEGATPGGFQVDPTGQGTNVSLGGSQDIGFFRGQLEQGLVPSPESLDAAGFFAEHHTDLPPPSCGERVCLQPMLAVMGNLMDGGNCTMLHLGLNSPLAADPGQRPPLSLAVVVDVSGSMQGEKLRYVQDGLELLIDGMRDGDQLALVSYSSRAEVLFPMAEVSLHRAELREIVRGLRADGATNLSDGLEAGYQEVLGGYDTGRQNRVILLSDGVPTAGIEHTPSILDLSRGYNSDGVGLTTVGLGLDFNVELMRGLAQQADGNFYFVEDAGAVDEVFTEELDYFVVPIAFDLEVRLSTGEYYDFGRALGSPFWTDTVDGGGLEVPSAFIAHRTSDADVTDTGGRRGGGSQLIVEVMPNGSLGEPGSTVATVDVRFREPGTNAIVTDTVDVTYPYAPSELRREGFFDADNVATVQKSFVMLNVFVGLEQATLSFHRGGAGPDTIARLDNLIAAVDDYNDEVRDVDIDFDRELLAMLRENLIRNGVPESFSPPPQDSWPAD